MFSTVEGRGYNAVGMESANEDGSFSQPRQARFRQHLFRSGPRAALAPPTFWPFPASGFCPRAPPPPGRFSVSSAASFSPDC